MGEEEEEAWGEEEEEGMGEVEEEGEWRERVIRRR